MRVILIILTLILPIFTNAQEIVPTNNNSGIDTIKDFRIKIDGGGSFYSYDSISFDRKQLIFVISAKKIAFINIKGKKDYTYLKRIKITNYNNLYRKEVFSGKGYTIILTTKVTGKRDIYPYITWEGTLEILGKTKQVIKVHGVIDEP